MPITPSINDIREITFVLSKYLKIDISNYAFSFLRRRFAYIFNELRFRNIDLFIESIKKEEGKEEFNYLFPVEENELFRDPSFWRTLRLKIVPTLKNRFFFWFPELVSAEELLSLLVILKELNIIESSKIFCNVSSSKRIEYIKQGRISTRFKDLNKQNFKRLELNANFEDYFAEKDGSIFIDSELIKNVEFIHDNYFVIKPKSDISVTIFRNRMLYYNSKLQQIAEKELHGFLNKDSYLMIGINERILPENETHFELYDNAEQIYKVLK